MKYLVLLLFLVMMGCTTVKHYHYHTYEAEEMGLWDSLDMLADQDEEEI